MASAAEDRRWVVQQWQYLFGRMPTADEVNYSVGYLQGGMSRSAWMAQSEKSGADEAITRIYKETLGREPNAQELAYHRNGFRIGRTTRKYLKESLSTSTEALTRTPEEAPDPGKENARDYITSVLESYGLAGLGDWAWEQIQAGHTQQRILQDLRQTGEYKQRFVGMEARKAAGLPAISEGEYIAYERDVRQLMRAAGLPPDFYDQPQDFATFIGQDVSVSEMASRINEGYMAASQAPADVKAQLRDLYGVGDAELAAFFLDPDRAAPLIERQWTAAKISGAAKTTGYGGLNVAEAEGLAAQGVTQQQAAEGFSTLADNAELFGALPGEQDGLITREEQMGAVFGNNAKDRQKVEQKAGARRSAASGAGAFSLGQGGASGLSRTT